jgi:hypothetical protein
LTVTTSPTWTAARKLISSRETVTHIPPECLIAASPAAVSTSFMIVPPWTMPATFVSTIVISSASTTWESATGFGSRFHSVIGGSMLAERHRGPLFRRDDLQAAAPG